MSWRHSLLPLFIVALGADAGAQGVRFRIPAPVTPEVPPQATPTFLPTGNGTTSTWTANGAATVWQSVDDAVDTCDNDTTYASKADSDGQQFFTFTTPTVPGGSTINSVSVKVCYRAGSSSFVLYRTGLRVGGTNYYNTGVTVSSTTYTSPTATWITNPRTGVAWTVNDVNGVGANALQEFGVSATVMSAGESFRVSAVYMKIDYAVGGGGSGTIPANPTGYSPADNATGILTTRTLSCNNQADATGYRIFLSTTSPLVRDATTERTLPDTSVCNVTVSGMANSDEMFWAVCPYNGNGENCATPEQSFTTVASGTSGDIDIAPGKAPCPSSADDSPTGRNNLLLWTCERQNDWNRHVANFFAACPGATAMVACSATPSSLGGKWFKTLKTYCDLPVGQYADPGLVCARVYQMTGDVGYATGARGFWAKISASGYLNPAVAFRDPNATRVFYAQGLIALERVWPALNDTQRAQIVAEMDQTTDYDHGPNYFRGSYPWADTDQFVNHAYLPVVMEHILLPNNASNEVWYQDSETGGYDSTSGVMRTSARNHLRFLVETVADGGSWMEGGMYDPETVTTMLVSAQAISDALGYDAFPELTAWRPKFTRWYISQITPNLARNVQLGDEQDPDIFKPNVAGDVLRALVGLQPGTIEGGMAYQLLLDLNAKFGVTGYGSVEPSGTKYWGIDVFSDGDVTPTDYTTIKGVVAPGYGVMTLKSGWGANESLFFAHCNPRIPGYGYDHQPHYMCDWQLYDNNEWVQWHTFSYAGSASSGEGTNVMRFNGWADANEYKKLNGYQVADTHAFISMTTGGARMSVTWNFPTTYLNEGTTRILHVPGVIPRTFIHNRANVDVIIDPQNYGSTTECGPFYNQRWTNEAHARQEWLIHAPVDVTYANGQFTWVTPQTSQTVKVTPLLPAARTQTIYDVNTEFADGAGPISRCGWADTAILPRYEIDTAPYNHKIIKIWPEVMGQFHTYLNIHETGVASLKPTLVPATNNAECGHAPAPSQNDVLACFNGTPSGSLADPYFDPSHSAALDVVRLRGVGSYTVSNYIPLTGTTEFFVVDLDPSKTWVYSVDGGGSVSIPTGTVGSGGLLDTGGFRRIVLSMTAGVAHTITVTGS